MSSYLFLVGSIMLTSWLTLSFKVIERFHINVLQAIVFNYITCVITGSLFLGRFPVLEAGKESWFPWAIIMGLLFITLFNLVGYVSGRIGVSVAAVAFKLSLVIPFLFAVLFYHESITGIKILGVLIAIPAVVFTCIPAEKEKTTEGRPVTWLLWIMPLLLFFGSGILDTMINYVEHEYLNDQNGDTYLITAFTVAAVAGIILLLLQIIRGRQKIAWKAIVAGISIGIPNYFSIWCFVKALEGFANNSSAVIPVNNMGVVLISSIVAWGLMKEKLSVKNWVGIGLSVLAIAFIAYG